MSTWQQQTQLEHQYYSNNNLNYLHSSCLHFREAGIKMGNSGSIHNLHTDGVRDLNSFYRTPRSRSRLAKKTQQEGNGSPIFRWHGDARNVSNTSWSKSFPRTHHHASINDSPPPQVKVLPQRNESLQLRSTANGAILHSGGTISGRREPQQAQMTTPLKKPVSLPPTALMQRSHTLIYEKSKPLNNIISSSNQKSSAPIFRRAHTQFQMKYGGANAKVKLDDNIETTAILTLSEPDLHQGFGDAKKMLPVQQPSKQQSNVSVKNTKTNKYNKKRKAPPAPSSGTTPLTVNIDKNNNIVSSSGCNKKVLAPNIAASAALAHEAKSRLFRTKAETEAINNIPQRDKLASQQQQPQTSIARVSTKRGHSVSPQQQQEQRPPLLPYRREKSFDATILRGREPATQHHSHGPQKPVSQLATRVSKIPQLKSTFYFGMETRSSKANLGTKPLAGSKHLTKQIEDTSSNKAAIANKSTTEINVHAIAKNHDDTDSVTCSSLSLTPIYDISLGSKAFADDIDANGLQVHVRPTLPKRQLDIPRFSPAAAWRLLTERQQQLQLQRSSINFTKFAVPQTTDLSKVSQQLQGAESAEGILEEKISSGDSGNAGEAELVLKSNLQQQKEAPIQPKKNAPKLFVNTLQQQPHISGNPHIETTSKTYLAAWTPQQDLEEDDSSSDDLQRMKHTDGVDDGLYLLGTNTESNAKKPFVSNSSTSVHVFSLSLPRDGNDLKSSITFNEKLHKSSFSSLQKLKRTVSGGNCGCIQTKYNDHIMDQILSGISTTENIAPAAPSLAGVTETPLEVSASNYRSDNWVLGKNKLNVTGKQTNFGSDAKTIAVAAAASDKAHWDSLASLEPISLSYLTAGRHVMYLPNENVPQVPAIRRQLPQTEKKSQEKVRKKRESLQDGDSLSPPATTTIPSGKSDRAYTASAIAILLEKPQRFSFQSTVRLIEKRRLAEKLSKDAEIKEAQRRSELEAMKRVEEDFQRKRAFEKANIRQQLRLVSNLESMDHYHSLPATGSGYMRSLIRHEVANDDTNYRADPDGAVSSPSNSPLLRNATEQERFIYNQNMEISKETEQIPTATSFDYTCDRNTQQYRAADSDSHIDVLDFQRTALLVKPYLQSIVQ